MSGMHEEGIEGDEIGLPDVRRMYEALRRQACHIASVHVFANRMVMTLDRDGRQMCAFQGVDEDILPLLRLLEWDGEVWDSRIGRGDEPFIVYEDVELP
jgi:hypothetical protein